MTARQLTEKVRKIYNRDNVQVNTDLNRIEVYWMRDPHGKIWIPFSGGPLYFELAIKETNWLRNHIEEFRSLLPKKIRQWPIVIGELNTNTYPGVFTANHSYTINV